MDTHVFRDIFTHLEQYQQTASTTITLDHGRTLPLNAAFFFHDVVTPTNTIAFVDGGNGELIAAPNFSLQFIRIYTALWKNNRRINHELHEFYVAVTTHKKEGKLVYATKTFDADFDIIHDFDLNDATLSNSNHLVSPSIVAEAVRKFAELKLSAHIIAKLNSGDVLVRDGELAERVTFERPYLDKLFAAATTKNVAVCGFSKTTTLLTDSGDAAGAVLVRYKQIAPWYYLPHQSSEIMTGFVKLSPHTHYIFRIDFYNAKNPAMVVSALLENARDPSFLGYPYGLVDADLRARVTRQECTMLKLRFRSSFGEPFKQYCSALDAHDVLNVLG